VRRLQASHQERSSELAEMAVRTASRIDACLSLDTEQARAQLAQHREARRTSELQRLQGETRELEALLGRVQPRIDNVLSSAHSRAISPMTERSITSSLSSEALVAHRRHLRALTSGAEARIDGVLSPTTQELRTRAAEQRSLHQSSEVLAMRERHHQVRDLIDSATPRVDRELSPESHLQRNDFDYARALARAQDYISFSTRSQDLRDLRENTPRRVETSLSTRTLDERSIAESSRLHRLENRHREMREQHKLLRDLVAVRRSVVDAYIDAEVRAKIRKEPLKAVQDAPPAARPQAKQNNEVTEGAPMHHQQLWQAVPGTTSRGQEQILNKPEVEDMERGMSTVSQEVLDSTTTQRPSTGSSQQVELELVAMQDQLRAKHQARERQNVTMLSGSARGATPVANHEEGHAITSTTTGSERLAPKQSEDFTSFMEDHRQQDIGSFVAT